MQNLAQQGKDFGQTTINTGTHKVTLDFRKRVDWDQENSGQVLDQMDPDAARHYATVKIRLPEAKYKTAPPEIKAFFLKRALFICKVYPLTFKIRNR